MKVALLFFGVLAFVSGQSTNVQQCTWTSNTPLPLNAYIEGCPNTPCPAPSGGFATIDVVFKAPHTMRSMTTLAQASLLGLVPLTHDLGEDAVTCNHLVNTYCPVLKDEVVMYRLRMEIDTNWPLITVIVEFRIVDENNVPIMCIRLPITVVATANQRIGNSTLTLN